MNQPSAPSGTPAGSAQAAPLCAACGASLAGRFCARCGAAADPGLCPACHTALSPGARFCHRCGARAGGGNAPGARRERLAWIVAGSAVLLVVLLVLWRSGSFRPSAPPEMANVGNVGAGPPSSGLSTRAPDISSLTPEQRFDRLFDRVMRAQESGDSVTVRQFTPMALGAYAMLPPPGSNNDQLFHVALIELANGETAAALARADTLLTRSPGHLFAHYIRGEAAEQRNDTALLARSYRDFLANYDAELRTGRGEYTEHANLLADFRTRALASKRQ